MEYKICKWLKKLASHLSNYNYRVAAEACYNIIGIMAAKNDHVPDHNFNFHRRGSTGQIIVSNNMSYTMAEYSELTGLTRWHRVVPIAQREKVQNWLLIQYPVKIETATAKKRPVASVRDIKLLSVQ